jgi:hypothetical protein
LHRARADTDALPMDGVLPPIRDRFEDLRRQVDQTQDETTTALSAVRLAPAILGANGERNYFVAFTTPSESRGLGGFMGSYGVLNARDGRLALPRHGRADTLDRGPDDPPRTLDAPPDYLYRYGPHKPQEIVRDITLSPDMPSVAQAIRSVYPQTRDGGPIDGVIAMDPYAVAAILRLTGPIHLTQLDEPLTNDNAADILLRRQYEQFDGAWDDRIELLDEAARSAFDALTNLRSVEPARWSEVLGPIVAQRRLMVSLNRRDEQQLVERLHLDGAFPKVEGGDFFALVTQNGGNNKIDYYLHREVDYRADWDPDTGALHATATITLRNEAPASGLPGYVIRNRGDSGQPDGTNWLGLNVYSPHRLEGATVDGQLLKLGTSPEFGLNVHHGYLAVPAASTVRVELRLTGVVAPLEGTHDRTDGVAERRYRVRRFQQPTVHRDRFTLDLVVPSEWEFEKPGPSAEGGTATDDEDVGVTERREG